MFLGLGVLAVRALIRTVVLWRHAGPSPARAQCRERLTSMEWIPGNDAHREGQAGLNRPARNRAERDQGNALDAWPEHGLLGAQLGPNKNGRKW